MKIFDYLSPQVYLRSFNKQKLQTNVGGLLYILISLISVGFSTYFSLDLIYKYNPKSSYLIQKFLPDVGEVSMHKKGIFHYITIKNLKNKEFEISPRIFEIEGRMFSLDNQIDIKYSYDNCNKLNYENEIQKELINPSFNYSMCLYSQKVNQTLKTIYDKDFVTPILNYGMRAVEKIPVIYSIFVKRCQNSTNNNFHCLPNEIINNYADDNVLHFNFVDNYFDIANYTNPSTPYNIGTSERLSINNYARNSINLQRVKIITNNGIIFDNKEEIDSFSYDFNERAVIIKNNDEDKMIVSEFTFYLQNFVKVYERSYTRLQDVLANIGGFIKMLTIISSIINYPFFRFRLLENTYFVINNYLEDFNEENIMNQKNISELSKENMIRKNDPVVNLVNFNINKTIKKSHDNKNNLNLKRFFLWTTFRSKDKFNDELEKFRNHILNEATIYELYFNYIELEKKLFHLANKQNIKFDNNKISYLDIKLKYDRILEI